MEKVSSDSMIKIDFEVFAFNKIWNFRKFLTSNLLSARSFCDKVVQCQQILQNALERTGAECFKLFIIEIILE